jgi:hypothetical protein
MTLLAMLPSLCTNNLKGLGATLTVMAAGEPAELSVGPAELCCVT